MKKQGVWGICLVGALTLGGRAAAQTGEAHVVPLQGYLTDALGAPVAVDVDLAFTLYRSPSGPDAVYSELQTIRPLQGYFTAYLGAEGGLDPAIFHDEPILYVGVRVGDDPEMVPRFRLGEVPYAAHAQSAGDAETLGGLGATDFAAAVHAHEWAELVGVPASLADGDVAFSEVSGVPAALADGDVAFSEVSGVPATLADGVVAWSELGSMPPTLADGVVAWSEVQGIPPDLANGDQDTTYQAGNGLTLGAGNTFAIHDAVTQRRIWASCGQNSAIRHVYQDGNVVCEPLEAQLSCYVEHWTFGVPPGGYSGDRVLGCSPGYTATGGGYYVVGGAGGNPMNLRPIRAEVHEGHNAFVGNFGNAGAGYIDVEMTTRCCVIVN